MVSVGVIRVKCDACKRIVTGKYIHYSDGTIFCKECYESLPKCLGCKKPILGGEDEAIDGLCPNCYKRAPKCDICGRAIFGSYTRFFDGTISCDECMKKYLKCERCGKPVVKYTTIRGKILCKYCLAHAPRCSVCNNPIIGTYWIFDQESICNYCYKIYERCDQCGIPRQILFTFYDKKICYSCKEKAKRCSACGLPIVGKYYSYKNQSGIFCEDCEQAAPHCDSCGRPVGVKYMEISDGRKICFECQRSAITTDEQLEKLFESARCGLNELGIRITHPINTRLVSKRLLDQRIKQFGVEAAAGKNLGLFERKGDKFAIYIESHLPRQIALGTITHELAHAWQSENVTVRNQSLMIREGFAEWVSYKILVRFGYHGQAEMIRSRDDLYGHGFQLFRELEEEKGVEAVIEWAKTAK